LRFFRFFLVAAYQKLVIFFFMNEVSLEMSRLFILEDAGEVFAA
jgi:hypothetical protein